MLIALTLATSVCAEFVYRFIGAALDEDMVLPSWIGWVLYIAAGQILAAIFGFSVLDGLASAGGAAIISAVTGALDRYPTLPTPRYRREP